ncbi:MAG: hypothetical protein NZL95_04280, partial [Chitinophagales bacterium]|nr:hypothetical protein [Chitinophagales bacterium]MDW8427748.1 hypothetical protein [Chitinophagales bacterium]
MTENLNEPSWTKVGVFPPYLVVQGGIRNEPIKLKVFFNGYMVSENDFEVWTYYYHFDFVFRDLLKGTVHAYTGGFYTEYTYPPNVCFKSAFAP